VQRTIAGVLGIAMNKVEVDTTRLGGGFGAKKIRQLHGLYYVHWLHMI
jgi:xanthine dehydrogenase molybdopterin-binding subunit B